MCTKSVPFYRNYVNTSSSKRMTLSLHKYLKTLKPRKDISNHEIINNNNLENNYEPVFINFDKRSWFITFVIIFNFKNLRGNVLTNFLIFRYHSKWKIKNICLSRDDIRIRRNKNVKSPSIVQSTIGFLKIFPYYDQGERVNVTPI